MDNQTTLQQRMKRSSRTIFVWASAWLVSLALIAFGPKFLWDYAPTFSIISIVINLFMGYKMIIAHKQQLAAMDEMQRTIHMNAMAISLGTSLVFGAVYGLLYPIQLLSFSPNPANILFVMGLSYMFSVFVGFRKYL